MRKRYPVPRSELGRASRFMAAMGVPTLFAAAVAYRSGIIAANQLELSLLLGVALGLSGLGLAITAIILWWQRGGTGVGDAVRAVFYGVVLLVPLTLLAAGWNMFPQINDISTDPSDPPPAVEALSARDALAPPRFDATLQMQAYPEIVSRRFRLEPVDLHAAVRKVMEKNGWEIVTELKPDMRDSPSLLQAVARVPFIGLPAGISVRVEPDVTGSILDVRASSRFAVHDLGFNAQQIRRFYRDLDAALTEAYGSIGRLNVTEEEAEEARAQAEELPFLTEQPQEDANRPVPLPGFKPYQAPEPAAADPEFDEIYQGDDTQG
ncbi:DUF1499 domain-containing protein [Pannonibacter phragmitetus]|uniref:DUF1499 domain-containing protein n=1 Tax=Pannonibacter phragmitetus TaxID=121719 RepID=UPI003D2F0B8E